MTDIPPELQQALDRARGAPLLLLDRRTQETFVLVNADVYRQLADEPTPEPKCEVPEGIRRARAALLRDFPAMLADRRLRDKFVCYHLEKRVAVGKDYRALLEECFRRGIPDDELLIAEVTRGSEIEHREMAECETDPTDAPV